MTVQQALEQLLPYNSEVPKEALDVIRRNWPEAEPKLLAELDRCIMQPVESDSGVLFLYALYLCAEMRCEAAFDRYIRILRLPEVLIDHLIGDILTQAMGQMLARTCAGREAELKALVEDEVVFEFARSTAMEALQLLVVIGSYAREEVERYCIDLLSSKLERHHTYMWDAVVLTVMELGIKSALPLIETAYKNGWADSGMCSLEEVRDSLQDYSDERDSRGMRERTETFETVHAMRFFTDSWKGVEEPDPAELLHEPREQRRQKDFQPVFTHVGRNAPCPCGSGKKFKKCCIGKEVPAPEPVSGRDVVPPNIADEWIAAGYYYVQSDQQQLALTCWWHGWREAKDLLPEAVANPKDQVCNKLFPASVFFSNWLEDYRSLLEANMKLDADIVWNGLQYCVQVRQRFPEMDTLSANNLIETTAYLLTVLGRSEEAFALLQQIIEQQPNTAQGYAVWASLLTVDARYFNLHPDVDRARQLLRQALENATDCEAWDVEARLEELLEFV